MQNTIQIENLGFSIDDRDLARLFAPHGAVHCAKVSTHLDSGQSTGIGFVQMERDEEGALAIAALNGQTHCGRILSVCWSKLERNQDMTRQELFGPMNIAGAIETPPAADERRGLP